MRCTDCSREVRPVVALDIDGTLGDYHAHFINFAYMYLGYDEAPAGELYDGSLPFRGWFCGMFAVTVDEFRSIKLAYRQGAMKRNMPTYPWAASLVRSLIHHAEVWLTTTRPWARYDRVDPDTHAWLERNNIPFDGVLYDEDKYARLAEIVEADRVCAVLDDEPEQYDRAQEVFGGTTAILRCNRYNRAVTRPIMAANLEAAHIMIQGHIDQWEQRHDRAA